jgi:hypothetical protein
MKPVFLLVTCLAAFTASAPAKLGETMSQALVRLGQPERRDGDRLNATWTWKREKTSTKIEFEKNASVVETTNRDGTFTEKEINDLLTHAGNGPWQKGKEPATYTNGPLTAETKAWEVKIFHTQKEELDGPNPKVDTVAELKERLNLGDSQTAALEKQLGTERSAGLKRIYGKVLHIFPEGHVVQCDDKASAFRGRVLVTGLKSTDPIAEGSLVEILVRTNGTFQNKAIDAGAHTIPKADFAAPIPSVPPEK